jgi:hypothetical protein
VLHCNFAKATQPQRKKVSKARQKLIDSCGNGLHQQKERNHLSFYGTRSTGEARSDKPLAQYYDFARYWYHNTVETTFKSRTASRAVQ